MAAANLPQTPNDRATDPVVALIAEYDRLGDILTPIERADALRFALPVYLRGPACVQLGGDTVFYSEEDIRSYFAEVDEPGAAEWAARLRADLAAYKTAVACAEEGCGIAALDRRAAEIEAVRSAVYTQIETTPAATFDGLAAHIHFFVDDTSVDEVELAIILAGLDTVRRRVEGEQAIGFGPREAVS